MHFFSVVGCGAAEEASEYDRSRRQGGLSLLELFHPQQVCLCVGFPLSLLACVKTSHSDDQRVRL